MVYNAVVYRMKTKDLFMCLAVPVRVQKIIDASKAQVETGGVQLMVSTRLYPNLQAGDYVLVHAGFVIEKLSSEDAQEKIQLYAEYKEMIGEPWQKP